MIFSVAKIWRRSKSSLSGNIYVKILTFNIDIFDFKKVKILNLILKGGKYLTKNFKKFIL